MNTRGLSSIIAVGIISIVVSSCYGFDSKRARTKDLSTEKKFVVVELFTSEGCSSCPPADALLSKLLSENNNEVYLLSYHVDYWDRLGWKDPFSQSNFSDRQRRYAEQLHLESVYTPQMVVNGTEQFVGSSEQGVRSALKHLKPSYLKIEAGKDQQGNIRVSYTITSNTPVLLRIALVQAEANSVVTQGENKGKKLHHVNVVRELKSVEAKSATGELAVEVPKDLRGTPLNVIAYTQQRDDLSITGADKATVK